MVDVRLARQAGYHAARRPALTDAARPTAAASPLGPEDDALLRAEVEVEPDARVAILSLYRTLGDRDHYALLGVERSADKKALKRAYYDRAAKFHPDKYFRKNIGDYKPRLEAIFARLTLAHDTLADPQRRGEYDAYLAERSQTRSIEDILREAMAEAARVEEQADRDARASDPSMAVAAQAPPTVPAPPPVPQPTVNVAMAARRDALARRLLGGRTASSSSMPAAGRGSAPNVAAVPPRMTTEEAMEAMRRRYEDRRRAARVAQARAYVQRGREALDKGDAVGAANSFQVALSLSPDDPELLQTARAAQARATALLAQTYAKQAFYEEKHGQFAEAARSWGRVCSATPDDPAPHERAATMLVRAQGDLHEAVRLAKRACELDPESAIFRTALAGAYLAAGLLLNARRELETAAQLAPQDGTIQAMLRRLDQPR